MIIIHWAEWVVGIVTGWLLSELVRDKSSKKDKEAKL